MIEISVRIASSEGCIGLILYSDTIDYVEDEEVYPESASLPGTAVQRGTVKALEGDVLTPGYPAICK